MLIPQAYAQAAGQPPQGGGLFLPLMMVGILLFMYFTTIRPQRKRQKEHAAMLQGERLYWKGASALPHQNGLLLPMPSPLDTNQ